MLTRRGFFGRIVRDQRARHTLSHATASLDPHTESWTEEKARHLLRRTGCGAPIDLVEELSALSSAAEAVDLIFERAAAVPEPQKPQWFLDRKDGVSFRRWPL